MANTMYERMCDPKVVALAGFCWGLSQHVKLDTKTVDSPLASAFNGAIVGSFYVVGTAIITYFLPRELNGIVTTLCVAGIVVQKAQEVRELVTPAESNQSNNSVQSVQIK
ncbi:MAG: hypothetical protein Homavirus19_3 [Homavirus sp.]|uniref:Uncharacterized protein n=1 Tax=Homavirus sp. TaxID=2487769 RepID=A0A3G5A6W6_9VIRU|nr:MAG: hypothetical protein Homavirus19_3 [Homavirus sp.]